MPSKGCPEDLQSHFEALHVSRETMERLEIYERLLLEWAPRINLVARSTFDQVWRRHFLDSLQLASHLPKDGEIIADLGSGAGFPGMVLAIHLGCSVTLVEVDAKKIAFLRTVSRETQTPVRLVQQRIETLESLQVDVLTSRACAPLELLLSYAEQHLAMGGTCLFLKGREVDQEIQKIKDINHLDLQQIPSISDCQGTLLKIKRTRLA
ncbi:MAG: 16S rRNA (guanine(527)-N(7))-methyltransferase RsmG [Holosporales bacterium]